LKKISAMVPLHQPKWRKFLSLKGEPAVLIDDPPSSSQIEEPVPLTNASKNESTVVDAATPPKKRKRTEEEIASRKAKKLKSKNKEGQEWKQLTDDHENQQVAQSKAESNEEPSEIQVGENTKLTTDNSKADAALLSTKAKEIAKARRDEKLKEKQKKPEKSVAESRDSDKKASRVLEYLDEYQVHVDTGSGWKFKKQHQNWIVKHLYSYPWKSDELVIRYLKTVQGQARKRLIEEANKVKDEKEGPHGERVIRTAENVISALEE
jgi:hypothetical protein